MARRGGRFGLFLGLITGTVTGLLFAPEKGKKFRESIAKSGHKAIGQSLTKMADEVADLVKEVAQSDEAKHFWNNTSDTVSEWTDGSVDLDEWVKRAHQKADNLKKQVSAFAEAHKGDVKKAKTVAKKTVKKAKTAAKTVKKKAETAKKAATKAVKKASKAPAKRKTTAKKTTAAKATSSKSVSRKKAPARKTSAKKK